MSPRRRAELNSPVRTEPDLGESLPAKCLNCHLAINSTAGTQTEENPMIKVPRCPDDFDLARYDGERWHSLRAHYWRGFVGFVLLTLAALGGLAWVIGEF